MRLVRLSALLAGIGILSACGGGGGGGGSAAPPPPPPAAQFSVSTSTLVFNAAEPKSAVPAAQEVTGTVTGTINGTTLYVLITVTGDVVDSVSQPVISGTTGSALVSPVAPMALGMGTFNGTLNVRACVDSPTCASGELSGSPRVVNVTYTIGSPVQQDAVVPHVVARDAEGTVILRGTGLGAVTSVSFGANLGGTPTVRNATEVSVPYAPMSPGTYAVSLNNGAVPFTGSLVVADSPAFSEATLTYPVAPTAVEALVYDAERHALLVALSYSDPNDNRVLRYTFDGTNWSSTPTSITFARVRDLALSNRGDRVIVLREYEIMEVDPTSLATINQATNLDFVGHVGFMSHLALSNDGHVLVASDIRGSGLTDTHLYSLKTHAFTKLSYRGGILSGNAKTIGRISRGMPAASGNGARVVIVPADSDFPPIVLQYADGRLTETSLNFFHRTNYYRPALDRDASRIVMSDGAMTPVFGNNYGLQCSLPAETRAYAMSPSGNRAFTVNTMKVLQSYQLGPNGGACVQDGPNTTLSFDPGIDPLGFGFPTSNVRTAISPDAATLFFAGVNGILVKPWP